MRSTLDKIKDRVEENLQSIKDYISGNAQKTFAADEVDLLDSSLMDSAIRTPDNDLAQSELPKNTQVGELSEAYALKRDFFYTYAGRSWLMLNGVDSKLGDEFRNGRWEAYARKMEEKEEQ